MSVINKIQRYIGSLIGLAVGDALGATIEFQTRGNFEPIKIIVGGGTFNLRPGEWTDDTSMALCLADSLLECNGFNPTNQMEKYLKWYEEGYLSSTGICFDIGNTVVSAIKRFKISGEPYSGSSEPYTAGNGSLMRLSPIPLMYAHSFEQTISYAAQSSKTTHGALEAVDACRYYAALIYGAVNGEPKDTLLSELYTPVPNYWQNNPLTNKIKDIASGSYKIKKEPDIQGIGYVVKSIEAALWSFYNTNNFKDGALLAVNLGDDADTTGAIYAQLAGAYYGINAIPSTWQNVIHEKDLIIKYASDLYQLSHTLHITSVE